MALFGPARKAAAKVGAPLSGPNQPTQPGGSGGTPLTGPNLPASQAGSNTIINIPAASGHIANIIGTVQGVLSTPPADLTPSPAPGHLGVPIGIFAAHGFPAMENHPATHNALVRIAMAAFSRMLPV